VLQTVDFFSCARFLEVKYTRSHYINSADVPRFFE
jgi:hypothetical protein